MGQNERVPDWFKTGNCRHIGLELAVVFLYSKHGKTAKTDEHTPQTIAKGICYKGANDRGVECPVLLRCRKYGKNLPGIYGGMTKNERKEYFGNKEEEIA